jgi:broad specificity phosphatase PhoE
MSTIVHLVRHGQVENPAGVIYGRLPGYHLSELGRRQAEAAARRLADHDLRAVWSSPLERARETATLIADLHGIEIVVDDRLIESGTTLEGVGRRARDFALSPRHWWSLRNPMKPSWGESFREIRERMLAAVRDALESAEGGEVAVVSHQTPVLVARLGLARRTIPPWLAFIPCETGSVTSLLLEGEDVVSASYFAPTGTL